MKNTRTRRKRCLKCGHVADVKVRQQYCRKAERNAMGKTGYWCYGQLVSVETIAKATAQAAPASRPQDVARKRLDALRRLLDRNASETDALIASLARKRKHAKTLEARARYQERRAAMTDTELAADRERRIAARARKLRRGIAIGE